MKTEWDYSKLADAYLKRPDYAEAAIESIIKIACITDSSTICDVGAGVAHLTLMFAKRGLVVKSVEPNDSMRKNGQLRTKEYNNVNWYEGTGEETGQNEEVRRS